MSAGWIAVAAAAVTTLSESAAAGGDLSPATLKAYLLTNVAGASRLVTIVLMLAAVGLVRRWRRLAGASVVLALLCFPLGGHANSAVARIPTITTDWVHLVAAAVWAGGIAQIATTWCLSGDTQTIGGRRTALRQVLPRFGKVALPAFIVLAAVGSVNAALQLGSLDALVATSYGIVLLVKLAIVAAMALTSYVHAMRIRPRLLAGGRQSDYGRLEARHWRLLGSEAAMSWAVLLAVAVLIAFPLPPGQLGAVRRDGPPASQIARQPPPTAPTTDVAYRLP